MTKGRRVRALSSCSYDRGKAYPALDITIKDDAFAVVVAAQQQLIFEQTCNFAALEFMFCFIRMECVLYNNTTN